MTKFNLSLTSLFVTAKDMLYSCQFKKANDKKFFPDLHSLLYLMSNSRYKGIYVYLET